MPDKGSSVFKTGMATAFLLWAGGAYGAERAAVEPLAQAHAHNDYLHARPLFDALDHGFASVEADIFLVDGKLLVGHAKSELKADRTLQALARGASADSPYACWRRNSSLRAAICTPGVLVGLSTISTGSAGCLWASMCIKDSAGASSRSPVMIAIRLPGACSSSSQTASASSNTVLAARV